MERTLVSVVVPCYNEGENIPRLYQALVSVFASLDPHCAAEFLFIDDGSDDDTLVMIEKLAAADPRIKFISFSRNFGKEVAMAAGIHHAHGDAVITLDADLQHPPELIPLFLEKWRRGAEVVIGVRKGNGDYSFIKKFGSATYYWLMGATSEAATVPRETDFRLIGRVVADAFNAFTEHERNTRALIHWLGFKKEYIEFEADKRKNGRTSYSFGKLLHLAVYSFISHSLFPLRIAGYLGVFVAFFSGLLGATVFFEQYIFHDAWQWHVSGSAQLSIVNAFLIGIVLICFGIVALYIGNVQNEVTNRPLYVIREKKL